MTAVRPLLPLLLSFRQKLFYPQYTTMPSSVHTAMIVLAEGAEEMELVITTDVLRRAGILVTVAGLSGNAPVKCSRDVWITPDKSFIDAVEKDPYDILILPGGLGGSKNLSGSAQVGDYLRRQEKDGRYIAAICAAPLALKAHSVGLGKRLTSYPTTRNDMLEGGLYEYVDEKVVVDDKLITSQGPGTAFLFALAIIETLMGKPLRDVVAKGLLLE